MSAPSSQALTVWVQEELTTTDWVSLREILFCILKKRMTGRSEEDVWECVEDRIQFVANDLRNCVAEWLVDGAPHRIEIDNEPSPYVRAMVAYPSELLSKLRQINPFTFEEICAEILKALGATSRTTQKTNDEGVDFFGVNLSTVPAILALPAACKAVVIGQAKRYKEGNLISETRLREFIGAGTLQRHKLLKEGTIGPLAPVLFAFWTTSSFDQNAKRYARDLGIWYMDGPTLANYVDVLGLIDRVMSIPNAVSPIFAAPR